MGDRAKDVVRRVLSRNPKRTVADSPLKPAGVLLLLYPKDGEHCILLNKRTHQVEHHKGEVSFPGGRKDDEDETLLSTALRETYEEMGVRPEHVELLGEIDDMPTSSRFLISTFVGTIPYPYDFKPNRSEVAEVLEVPISALMREDGIRDEVRLIDGKPVSSPAYAFQGRLIFGATARILNRLLELLDGDPDKEALWGTR